MAAPVEVHRLEVALTFVEQLILPFLVLLPSRTARITAGCGEFFFQAAIIATGTAWPKQSPAFGRGIWSVPLSAALL